MFMGAAPVAICRRWRTIPFDRTSDGIRIASQIERSFLLDVSRLSARCVASPRRESCSASIGHASVVRFPSLAFPYLFNGWLGALLLIVENVVSWQVILFELFEW